MGRFSFALAATAFACALALSACGSSDTDEGSSETADPAGPTTSVEGGEGDGDESDDGGAEAGTADDEADGGTAAVADPDGAADDESASCPTPVWDDLANSSGLIGIRDDEPVAFVDGQYQERFGDDDLTWTETAWFRPEFFDTPDLDGDCRADVVTIFVWNGGGSGVFSELVVFLNTASGLELATRTPLYDRTEIREFDFVGDELKLEYLVGGPDDAACCPSVVESTTLSAAQLLGNADGDPTGAGAEAAAPGGGGELTHEQIRDAFALDEPFLGYIGDCEQPFAEWNLVQGATPFCGRIVSVGGGEASIEIVDIDIGEPIPIRLVLTDDGWRVDWDAVG